MTHNKVMEEGTKVAIYFTLALGTGEIVESSTDQLLQFTLGDGSMAAPLEAVISQMQTGDKQQVTLQKPFGEVDEAYLQWLDKSYFDPKLPLEEGLIMAFSTPKSGEYNGTLMQIDEDQVQVDFNHPLAGQDIIFSVELVQAG